MQDDNSGLLFGPKIENEKPVANMCDEQPIQFDVSSGGQESLSDGRAEPMSENEDERVDFE